MAGTPSQAGAAAMTAEGDSPLYQFLKSMPLMGRNGVLIAAVATMMALAMIIYFTTRPSYKTLFSGLPEEEAGRVVEQLNKMGVPYELGGTGSTIKVPADRVYDLRLEMATLGMPRKGAGVGFEIFDQTSLVGMTDFMQRMNFQRALQGELARTVENLSAVQKARVHLVLPKRSLFVSEEKDASASVVMDLKRSLNSAQIDGIVHLVASAVEGLDENKVTLLDGKGNLIAGGRDDPEDGRLATDKGLALQRTIEKSLERRVQTMMDRVLGPDKSIIRITAELDLSRVERQEEKFDPEGQVPRSEQFVNESSRGTFGVGGVPGVQPNDPNDTMAAGATGSNQSRDVERETVNYEISKTTNRILLPVGSIQRLSVAVLVDGIYKAAADADESPVYETRSDDEMKRLQRIIEQAVGFRTDRGDTIEVTNTAFESLPLPEEQRIKFWEQPEFYLQVLMAMIILGMLLFILRPLVKKLLLPEEVVDDSLASAISELEQQLLAQGVGSAPSEEPMRLLVPDRATQMAQQMISEHLDEAREVLRNWLTSDEEEQ